MLNSDKHDHFGSIYEYQCFHDDHDDVMQRKGFPHLLPFGKPRASGYKGPVTWSSSVLFEVSLNTGWTNSRVDGDLKGRGTHVTSHQHRFLFFDYRTALSEMPDEISRNLASLHMSMWNWKDTHAGVHPPYYRYVTLKLKRCHGAILFGGELSAPGVAIPTTPCHQGHQNAPQFLVHIAQIIMRPGNLKILSFYTQ